MTTARKIVRRKKASKPAFSKAKAVRMLRKLAAAREPLTEATKEYDAAYAPLLDYLVEHEIEKVSATDEETDAEIGVTLVQGTTLKIDQDELRRLMPPSEYKKHCVSYIPLDVFRKLLAEGTISADIGHAVVSESSNKPYLSRSGF